METLPLLNPKFNFQKDCLANQPEEEIRQRLLSQMILEGGFPRELIVVEKSLKELLPKGKYPLRRIDILSYCKRGDRLMPLLLIECKAVKLTAKAQRQLIGYNYFLRAPFIALANGEEIRLGEYCLERKEWVFEKNSLNYAELIKKISVPSTVRG